MNIILYGRVPSKKNSKQIVCRGRYPKVLPSSAHQKWHKEQMSYLSNMSLSRLDSVDSVEMTFYAPDKRAGDLSNKAESVMDLFVDAGLLADDNWFVCPKLVLIFGGVDRENPRVEVCLYKYC